MPFCARILAIACGYEDADDLDHLRTDPACKLACDRLPDSGGDLCSQPTVSRWENAPSLREVVCMTYAMVGLYCASYARPPAAVTLDIDDTPVSCTGISNSPCSTVIMASAAFCPIHVYDTATAQPVADLREMVNACLYLHKTGCGWRYLPMGFGLWETVRTWHDRFRHDGIWSAIGGLRTRAAREKHGHAAEPSTAILDSQSVVSGPQKGERGADGNKKIKGIKRHILTCSLGFVLAVLATPANVHDTQAAGPLLDRVAEHGWAPKRVKVDGIYAGERMDAAAARHNLDVEVTTRPPEAKGFTPLPIRWRIERTFGTRTNHYRSLIRNLEQSAPAAENAVEIANFHRVLKAHRRESDCPT